MDDIQSWRSKIGLFHGSRQLRSCRCTSSASSTSEINLLSMCLKLSQFFVSSSQLLSEPFILSILLCLIITDIFCTVFLNCFQVARVRFINGVFPVSKKTFYMFCLLCCLNPPFISIVVKLLLVQSGNVEKNPGPPPPKLLSFGVWNVDSLLARDGVKKSYIESLQSLHKFDIFGICETYLTDKTQEGDLEIEGFAKIPKRADCKLATPQSRPRGGVCLYFKESLPIKRRSDLELLDETICAEISLNRKKIIYLLSYRSPSQTPAEFKVYMQKVLRLALKIHTL